jgi:hypothetical protein
VTGETNSNGRFLLEVPDVEAIPEFVALTAVRDNFFGGISYDQIVGTEDNGTLMVAESAVEEMAEEVGITQSTTASIIFGEVTWEPKTGDKTIG